MTVSVLAIFISKNGLEDKLKEELIKLLEPTRKEQGCINYDLHQSTDDINYFFLYENWQTQETLSAHLKSKHLQEFLQKASEYLDKPIEIKRAKHLDI